ncbi:hypothetical protein SDRG_10990 [Saprolegnia diclina VS20]|uniref:RING-CH-type domain-containing protein n=1 Tax=Saprolegnia diclina (strain VS20) TaxID=1156394 RepID=T0Q0M6_SAPDV|nr:hypothetical protein SDRG_10990 [Saprolegnia diclina VS20]EQC31389.1 hypothetical protein SDRG_10990 [Saprolegnia diclina VS20]|eukprot:XP_008615230.1 hypothetical protein SDRG_10990 [Saprolegnia diclina VS20]
MASAKVRPPKPNVLVASLRSLLSSMETTPVLPLECLRCYRRSTTDLIAACGCASYVHRDCLDARRALKRSAVTHCDACGEAYALYEVPSEAAEYKRRVRKAQLLRVLFVLLVVMFGCVMIWLVEKSKVRGHRSYTWSDDDRALNEWLASIGCPRFLAYFVISLFSTAIAICIFLGCQRVAPATERYLGACDKWFSCHCTTVLAVLLTVLLVGTMSLVGLYTVLMAVIGVLGAAASALAARRVYKIRVQYLRVQDRRLRSDGDVLHLA